ncbi:hypothetical protein D3C72_2348030 [compost metagenome]
MHLRGRAFEKTATAAGKQGVAAEQDRLEAGRPAHVRNVPGGVARHVQHGQVQVQFGQRHAVALGQRHVAARQAFMRGTIYGNAPDA